MGADGGRPSAPPGPQAASSRQTEAGAANPDIRPMVNSSQGKGRSGGPAAIMVWTYMTQGEAGGKTPARDRT
ncbi:hypothetical protein GCM10010420_35730 [Streptomyces glaucosporus]|uniref:Uncharacterized protein n=1 Tax=Streptomyces glaucosporus TaxID=284044 RepID=A0ABN3IJA1_9ACTN